MSEWTSVAALAITTIATITTVVWRTATISARVESIEGRVDDVAEDLKEHRAEDKEMHATVVALVTRTAVIEAKAEVTNKHTALHLAPPPAPSAR